MSSYLKVSKNELQVIIKQSWAQVTFALMIINVWLKQQIKELQLLALLLTLTSLRF